MFLRQNRAGHDNERNGFTLLEVVLATAIAVLLLGALYVALDTQMQLVQAGRDMVQQATISRTLLKRISNDVNNSIALSDPARFRRANQSQAPNSAASAAASATGTSATTAPTTSNGPNPNTIALPLAIQGDTATLNLYLSKVPREALYPTGNNGTSTASGGTQQPVGNNGQPIVVSDLRRVSYWLVGGNGDNAQGLARQEIKLATSDDAANALPPNVDNESSYIIAEEVKSLTFSYYDGTQWQDTWDSTQLGADGVTPIGSPLAISVSIDVTRGDGPNAPVKTYRQVIAIPTANGSTPQGSTTPGQTSLGGGS